MKTRLPDFAASGIKPAHALAWSPPAPVDLIATASFGVKRKPIRSLLYQPPKMEPIRHLSDRRRIDLMVLPFLLHQVLLDGANDRDHPEAIIIAEMFVTAMHQPLVGLSESKALSLADRCNKPAMKVYHSFFCEWKMSKAAMTLYCLICDMTGDGRLELVEGSELHRAIVKFQETWIDDAERAPKRFASAAKQAPKLYDALRAEGFFKDHQP